MGNEIKACVIIAGAPESSIDYYKDYIDGRFIICADSGYLKCRAIGVEPDLIIGDFDSSPKPDADCEIITLNTHKDDTDTLHCAQVAVDRGFNDIIILGGIGDRVDHTYANMLIINYCLERGANCVMLDFKNRISVTIKPLLLKKDGYKYFSLFPLFETCKDVTITGAEYNIQNVDINPGDMFAQSNSFVDDVFILFEKGKLMIIESND